MGVGFSMGGSRKAHHPTKRRKKKNGIGEWKKGYIESKLNNHL